MLLVRPRLSVAADDGPALEVVAQVPQPGRIGPGQRDAQRDDAAVGLGQRPAVAERRAQHREQRAHAGDRLRRRRASQHRLRVSALPHPVVFRAWRALAGKSAFAPLAGCQGIAGSQGHETGARAQALRRCGQGCGIDETEARRLRALDLRAGLVPGEADRAVGGELGHGARGLGLRHERARGLGHVALGDRGPRDRGLAAPRAVGRDRVVDGGDAQRLAQRGPERGRRGHQDQPRRARLLRELREPLDVGVAVGRFAFQREQGEEHGVAQVGVGEVGEQARQRGRRPQARLVGADGQPLARRAVRDVPVERGGSKPVLPRTGLRHAERIAQLHRRAGDRARGLALAELALGGQAQVAERLQDVVERLDLRLVRRLAGEERGGHAVELLPQRRRLRRGEVAGARYAERGEAGLHRQLGPRQVAAERVEIRLQRAAVQRRLQRLHESARSLCARGHARPHRKRTEEPGPHSRRQGARDQDVQRAPERPDREVIAPMAARELEEERALDAVLLAERERVGIALVLHEGQRAAALELAGRHRRVAAPVADQVGEAHARIEGEGLVRRGRVRHGQRRRPSGIVPGLPRLLRPGPGGGDEVRVLLAAGVHRVGRQARAGRHPGRPAALLLGQGLPELEPRPVGDVEPALHGGHPVLVAGGRYVPLRGEQEADGGHAWNPSRTLRPPEPRAGP